MNHLNISIVVPVYSGENYLKDLVDQISALHKKWIGENYTLQLLEAIFVDDASVDQSSKILDELAQKYSWVKVVNLSQNYGQHPATIAGILYSSGDWVVTMDEDLQHSPSDIVNLLRVVATSGADIVYAKPIKNVHRGIFRDFASRFYKKCLSTLTGNPNIEKFNSFRLIRGNVARAAASVCGHNTYFDITLNWFSNRVNSFQLAMEDIRHKNTLRSGYNFYKLLSHAKRLVITTQTKLLRIGAAIGVGAMLLSFLLAAYILYSYFAHPGSIDVRGWPSLFIAILFFGGITTFLVGIVLEYLTNMVLHFHGKPVFFVVDRSSDSILRELFCS